MARIVAVHGIANEFELNSSLENAWGPYLSGALELVGGAPLRIHDRSEFRVVGFGDFFRPKGDKRSIEVSTDISSLTAAEEDAIVQLWRAASNLESTEVTGPIQPPEHEGRATPRFIQRAILQLSKSRFMRAICGPNLQRGLLGVLGQVRIFLHDFEIKEAIITRVYEAMSEDTRVLIGHSLGSIVAYEALARPGRSTHQLITLGSPLGIPNLVFDALAPPPDPKGHGAWPNVDRWANISDDGDIVALVKKLGPLFPDEKRSIEDIRCHNGWKSHDVRRYLSDGSTTGLVLKRALDTAAQ
jgi:hypothetical protein